MYHLVGDYVRVGSTRSDPKHSIMVVDNGDTIISCNRPQRRVIFHVWQVVRSTDGTPDGLLPLSSADLIEVRNRFVESETERR